MRDLQRAFRKRRVEQQNRLQERVAALEAALDDMASAFLNVSDLVIASGALQGQPERAIALQTQLSRALSLAQRVESKETLDENKGIGSKSPTLDLESSTERTSVPPAREAPTMNALSSDATSHVTGSSTPHTELFTPSLTYGVLSSVAHTGPLAIPQTIMARSAAGHDSFLGRLYWFVTVSSVDALRGNAPEDARIKFQFSRRHDSTDSLLRRSYDAMQFMLYGQVTTAPRTLSAWPGFTDALTSERTDDDDEGFTMNLRAAIEKDVQNTGCRVDDYISTVELENYLRLQWGIMPETETVRLLLPSFSLPDNVVRQTLEHSRESELDPQKLSSQASVPSQLSDNTESKYGGFLHLGHPTLGEINASTYSNLVEPGSTNAASTEVTLPIETLMQGLNLASVCFGNEMRLERHAVDRAAMATFQAATAVH